MNRPRSIVRTLRILTFAAVCWIAVQATALAKPPEEDPGAGGVWKWMLAYLLVLLGIGLGLLVVLRTSGRRDRAKPEAYGEKRLLDED